MGLNYNLNLVIILFFNYLYLKHKILDNSRYFHLSH